MTISFKIINNPTDVLPDGKQFPKTRIAVVDRLPVCFKCKITIKNDNYCYFCRILNKFSCYDCNITDTLPCKPFIADFKSHQDLLCKVSYNG